MKIRVASLLLALALPLTAQAQDPAADQTEAIFYKAFYLEKGQRDFAGAMSLYEQFLAKAPEHKLAAAAAKQQYSLLDATGKTKERDAFKAKYEKLLGNAANAPAPGGAPGAGAGDRPARGEGEGRAGAGARPDPQAQQARIAELEKQLEKAKADGKEDEVKRLEQQIERAKAGGGRGPGAGGQAGPGGRRGGMMGAMMGNKKISEMTAEEVTQLKEGLANSSRMVDMVRNGQGGEEAAKKLETNIEALKKALEANKTEDAQKALDALKESMPRGRGRGGEGGGAGNGGGNRGGGGGNNGGGGGNNGGGGGNNGGGGGGR